MKKSIHILGYLSALMCGISLVVWIISFAGIALTSPLFKWTNLADYLVYVNNNSQFFQYLAKSFMIVFAIFFFILLACIHEKVSEEFKFFSRISLFFGFGFMLLSSLHYFIQVSTIRFALTYGNTQGILQFIQANPLSYSSSLNMLSWTIFLGLSSVFMYFATRKQKFSKTIFLAFLINGISCLIAGFGFLVQIDVITFIFINLGVGGALLIISITMMGYFSKIK